MDQIQCETTCWVLVCENRKGQMVGLHEYDDEPTANRAFDVAISEKVVLYKQDCTTVQVKSKVAGAYGVVSR